MANDRSNLWQKLKQEGWKPPASKTFANYSVEELELELGTFIANKMVKADLGIPSDAVESEQETQATPEPPVADSAPESPPVTPAPAPATPVRELVREGQPAVFAAAWPGVPRTDEPDKVAGLRLRTHGRNDPIRIDSRNRVWFQDEIRKPAQASPRARSVLTYRDRGVKTVTNRNQLGLVEESFEVAGDQRRDLQVKITLPAWQVGIYGDPGLPFRIHVYNGVTAFDRLDVVAYFGGRSEFVPSSVKVQYIGGELCYDINSVRDTLERLHREHVLKIGSFN